MKDKIMIFVIGLLVGAVLASGAFFIYMKTNSTNCDTQTTQMNGGTPPEMPNGENGQPPEMLNGENGQPPEKPDGENNSSESSKKSSSSTSTDIESTKKSNSETKESN